jgi:hypothetical protein
MNAVIVGAGAIGKERLRALRILGVKNMIIEINDTLSEYIINNVNTIFVCTPHDTSIKIIRDIRHYNKTVTILVEKPYLGKEEPLNVGLNYRFFKGVNELLLDVHKGLFGKLISVNMILALGNAPDSDKTWRLNPLRAGRGAILDPGIHLIDLAMIISKGTLESRGFINTNQFWNTGIEEDSHLLATDFWGTNYNIQASTVRWRNNFRIEVNGTDGYGIVEGRNHNYGNQTYRRGKRWAWQSGKPQKETEELVVDYDGEDSFLEETKAVLYGTDSIIQPATHIDNKRCLEFINTIK